jgi:hypothetical protein
VEWKGESAASTNQSKTAAKTLRTSVFFFKTGMFGLAFQRSMQRVLASFGSLREGPPGRHQTKPWTSSASLVFSWFHR